MQVTLESSISSSFYPISLEDIKAKVAKKMENETIHPIAESGRSTFLAKNDRIMSKK